MATKAFHRRGPVFALMALGVLSFTATLLAEDAPDAPVPLGFTVKTELPKQTPQAHRAYVTAGTNQFAFLIPYGFHLANDPVEGVLKFSNANGTSTISFTIHDSMPRKDGQIDPDACRELLLARHPHGRFLEQYDRNAGNGGGPAFDMAWTTLGGGAQQTSTVFLPSDAGVIEINATSSPDKFGELQSSLNLMMLTFVASDKNGKLDVVPLSDKI